MSGSYWPKIIISYPCGSILNHRWFLSFTRHAHIQFKSNTSLNEIFCTGGELFERSINGSCPSLYNPQTASAETLLKEAKTQGAIFFFKNGAFRALVLRLAIVCVFHCLQKCKQFYNLFANKQTICKQYWNNFMRVNFMQCGYSRLKYICRKGCSSFFVQLGNYF